MAGNNTLRFRIGVDADPEGVELLLTPVFNGSDLDPYRVPLDAAAARKLASYLLGAAAKVDLVGHERMLGQITEMFGLHIDLLSIPPGAMVEH
jgi:hypothetical protein